MWHILRAEFNYNKMLILGFSSIISLVCLYEKAVAGERKGYVFLVIYMMTTFWNIWRNKDRRNYQQASLPITCRKIAAARILVVLIAGLLADALYFLVYFVLNTRSPEAATKLLAYVGIVLVGFSIYFVLQDLGTAPLRRVRLSKTAIGVALLVAVVGIQILTAYTIFQTQATGKTHVLLHYLDKMNMLVDPPASDAAIWIFFALSLVFASLTIFTFGGRKSYLR